MTEPQDDAAPHVEIVAQRVLSTAVRGREVGGGPVTYRKSLRHAVPGDRLTVSAVKRWTFRRSSMLGGELVHVGFSLRALDRAGFQRPQPGAAGRLSCPAEGDARLVTALEAVGRGDLAGARVALLDVLEEEPGCLVAHATLGDLHAALGDVDVSLAHYTGAIRLGMGALTREDSLPISPECHVGLALIAALRGRATLLEHLGRHDDAHADLNRALAWLPADDSAHPAPAPAAGPA